MPKRTGRGKRVRLVAALALAASVAVVMGADPNGSAGSSAPRGPSAAAERQALVLGHIIQTAELVKQFGYATYAPELPHTDPSQFKYPVVVPGFPVFQHPVNLGRFQQSCGQCHRLSAPLPRRNDAPPDVLGQLPAPAVVAPPPAGFRRLTDASGTEQQPLWSPDGSHILYVAEPGDGHWALWIMNADGSGKRQLSGAPEAGWPDWSPDGSHIVYWATDAQGRGNIWVMSADGSGKRRITDGAMTAFPRWSPDGSHILYQARQGERWDVWLTPVSGGRPVRISKPDQDVLGNGQFSPDGTTVLYQVMVGGHGSLWVATFPTAEGRPDYTAAPGYRPGRLALDMDLGFGPSTRTWSPDGSSIAFLMYALQPLPNGQLGLSYKLWVSDAQGYETKSLTPAGTGTLADRDPAWSPDGRWIAFWAWNAGDLRAGIWKIRPDGRDLTPLTPDLGGDAFYPSWSPDGSTIAFSSDQGGSLDIWTVSAGRSAVSPGSRPLAATR